MVRLIAEVGSTHNGKWHECYCAICEAFDRGITDVKFQLLEDHHIKNGNIPIDARWMKELVEEGKKRGVNVFASVWSMKNADILLDAGATTVKVAYSACKDASFILYLSTVFEEVIVSCDVNTILPLKTKKLFCIPEYPVYQRLSFEGLFPKFDGFSDHTLGINQTIEAVQHGAKIIEKHVCQVPNSECPDARFALSWSKMGYLAEFFRNIK